MLDSTPRLKRWFYFLVGGGLNTALTYIAYLVMAFWLNYQIAYGIAYALGILFSYLFNAKVVFQVERSWKGLLAYPLVYLVQYGISALALGVLVERVGVPQAYAPLITIILLIPVTYALNNYVLRKFAPTTNTPSTNLK